MTKETGGSAFPVRSEKNEYNVEYQGAETGMTLRDWFAGMALQGYMAGEVCFRNLECGWTAKEIAEQSYAIAEDMLKEREK